MIILSGDSDTHVYIQENDDILDKNEEPISRLINADELRNQTKQLKKQISDFFPQLYQRMKKIIPAHNSRVLDIFFSHKA